MYGSVDMDGDAQLKDATTILKTVRKEQVVNGKININGTEVTPTNPAYYKADGSTGDDSDYDYMTFELPIVGKEITISANTFPGAYYVTGDTYARSEVTGQDEFFQFILPKAKITSEVTLTMEAEGDPSTFSMNLKVLRPADGEMMKLVKYSVAD